jgi:hypothetical protein
VRYGYYFYVRRSPSLAGKDGTSDAQSIRVKTQ